VVAGENGVFNFWDNRFVVTDDSRQNPFTLFKVTDKIFAHFIAHR
jgi:hypothetical protein